MYFNKLMSKVWYTFIGNNNRFLKWNREILTKLYDKNSNFSLKILNFVVNALDRCQGALQNLRKAEVWFVKHITGQK